MSKLKTFTDKVSEEGSPKVKNWLLIAEKYIGKLNSIIGDVSLKEDIAEEIRKIDISKIALNLIESGQVVNCTAMNFKASKFAILYIVQNTWEFKGKDGEYLHSLQPLVFKDKFIIPIEKLFLELNHY